MKIGINVEVDLDSGDYEIKFNNLSSPGEPMELSEIQQALSAVVKDFYIKVEKEDALPEGFTKELEN